MNCQSHLYQNSDPKLVARRWFLKDCGVGLAGMALGHLLGAPAAAVGETNTHNPLAPKAPHYPAKAKRVIYLFMAGAPSHLELFDNKPQLAKFDGTLPPPELLKGYRAAFINPNSKLLGPKFKFARARPVRRRTVRAAAAPGYGGRRDRDRAIDGDRRVQSCAGPDPDEHRLAAVRPAEHGRLGHVRPGERIAGSARLRRLQLGQEGPQRRQFELGQRLLADAVPGRAVSRQRRSGAVSLQSAGHRSAFADAIRSTQSSDSTAAISTPSAIPKSPPGSIRSKWRFACRPARRS